MKRAVIYEIVVNGRPRYRGQTLRVDPEKRFSQHLKAASDGCSSRVYEGLRALMTSDSIEFRIVREYPTTGDDRADRRLLDSEEVRFIADAWAVGDCDWNVSRGGKQGSFQSPEAREALRIAVNREDVRTRKSAFQKILQNDPSHRARIMEKLRKTTASPEYRLRLSATLKEAHNRPEVRVRKSMASREALNRPEVRAKLSSAQRLVAQRPGINGQRSASVKRTLAAKRQTRLLKTFDRRALMGMLLGGTP